MTTENTDIDMQMTDKEKEKLNNLLMTGVVQTALMVSSTYARPLTVENVLDADGCATNVLQVTCEFLKSPYRITVERINVASDHRSMADGG